MATLGDIERLTKEFADARDRLGATLRDLNDRIEMLKRQFLPGVKTQVGIAAEKKLDLKNAIESSKTLFESPRTIIMHGVKVGLQKGKGKIEWEKDQTDHIVKFIEKHFSEMADILIQTTKKPIKKALSNLSVAELKKLGIEVDDTGDQVVIKPTSTDIEKWVDKLLREKDEAGSEEEAA